MDKESIYKTKLDIFHVSSKIHLESILKNGLIPSISEFTSQVWTDDPNHDIDNLEPMIFATDINHLYDVLSYMVLEGKEAKYNPKKIVLFGIKNGSNLFKKKNINADEDYISFEPIPSKNLVIISDWQLWYETFSIIYFLNLSPETTFFNNLSSNQISSFFHKIKNDQMIFPSDIMRIDRLNSVDVNVAFFDDTILSNIDFDPNLMYVIESSDYLYLIEAWSSSCVDGFIKKYGIYSKNILKKAFRKRFKSRRSPYDFISIKYYEDLWSDGIEYGDITVMKFRKLNKSLKELSDQSIQKMQCFDVSLEDFGFKTENIEELIIPIVLYRGTNFPNRPLTIIKNGEKSLGEGIYFAIDPSDAECYGDYILSYSMNVPFRIANVSLGDLSTIEGGDADDYFIETLISNYSTIPIISKLSKWFNGNDNSIDDKIWRIFERKQYLHVCNQIRNFYTSKGFDGVGRVDFDISIFNQAKLSQLDLSKKVI